MTPPPEDLRSHQAATLQSLMSELKFAVVVTVVFLSMVWIDGWPTSMRGMFAFFAGPVWLITIAARWWRVKNQDPEEFWREDCAPSDEGAGPRLD